MNRWIRWSGLVGFFVVVALLVAGWMLAAGPLIKLAIEEFGAKATGAKVDVDSVDLSFSPLGIVVKGVQVADADKPMKNLFEFDRAQADLQLMPLLLGKGIVNHLALEGVALDTDRITSGALPKPSKPKKENVTKTDTLSSQSSKSDQPAKSKQSGNSALANIQDHVEQALPSTDEILAREPLKTVETGNALKEAFDIHKTSIDKSVAALPTEQTVKQYENQLNAIVNGKIKSLDDFQKRKKEFDALRKQFKHDQKAVRAARKAIQSGTSELSSKLKLLTAAPESDFNTLRQKYTLDGQGVSNVSALLFGAKTGKWTKTGLEYYEKLKPFLVSDNESDSSEKKEQVKKPEVKILPRDVHFASAQPMPSFWIKKMSFSIKVEEDDAFVVANNVTSEQSIVGLPTTFILKSQVLGDVHNLLVQGKIDRRAKQPVDEFKYSIERLNIDKMDLGFLGMKLQRSEMGLEGGLNIEAGILDGVGEAIFSKSQFTTKDRTIVAKELTSALARIPQFNLDYTLTGNLGAPNVGMNSDLDNRLEKVFGQVLNEKRRAFEKELKGKLKAQMLAYTKNYEKELKQLGIQESDLSKLDKSIEDLSRKKLASFQDQKKKQLEENAKKKRKELEEKAKEKLKNLF